jgi:hypothetical protein
MDHVDIFRKRGGATRNALDLGTCEVRRLALGMPFILLLSDYILMGLWQQHGSAPAVG